MERVNAGEHQVQETRGAPDVKPVQAEHTAIATEPRRVEHELGQRLVHRRRRRRRREAEVVAG